MAAPLAPHRCDIVYEIALSLRYFSDRSNEWYYYPSCFCIHLWWNLGSGNEAHACALSSKMIEIYKTNVHTCCFINLAKRVHMYILCLHTYERMYVVLVRIHTHSFCIWPQMPEGKPHGSKGRDRNWYCFTDINAVIDSSYWCDCSSTPLIPDLPSVWEKKEAYTGFQRQHSCFIISVSEHSVATVSLSSSK